MGVILEMKQSCAQDSREWRSCWIVAMPRLRISDYISRKCRWWETFLTSVSTYFPSFHSAHMRSQVKLDSFTNIKYLTYGSYSEDTVLPYAIRQLGAIASTCNLTRVTFDISLDDKQQPNQVLWSVLDGLLAGDRFPSLKQVELRRTISHELLPKLHKAGRLRVLGRSFWMDHRSVKENHETPILNRDGNVQESGSSITETTEERQYEGHTFTATDEPASPFQRDVYNPVVYFRGQGEHYITSGSWIYTYVVFSNIQSKQCHGQYLSRLTHHICKRTIRPLKKQLFEISRSYCEVMHSFPIFHPPRISRRSRVLHPGEIYVQ